MPRRAKPRKCGYFGNPKRECRCSPREVENYRSRISGPLLDRIDIHVEAPAVEFKELSSDERAKPSAAIRANAGMSPAQLKTPCKLDASSQEMLRLAMSELPVRGC